VIRVYHRTCQYTTLERVSISRQTRDRSLLLAYSPLAYSPSICTKRRSNCDFALASGALHHRGLSVSNGEAWTLGTTKFFELLDALVASLQPRLYIPFITSLSLYLSSQLGRSNDDVSPISS